MSDDNYWSRSLAHSVSRRAALKSSAALGLGAAFLAACGGSDGPPPGESAAEAGLVAKANDTSKSAKRGGTFKSSLSADVQTFDPFVTSITGQIPLQMAYSRLVRVKPGYMKPLNGEMVGDAAESWEYSPDGLTLTMKLRPNLFTAPIAPVNGRALDTQDVLYSWQRFAASGTSRASLANSVDPSAPILSVASPDPKTITISLKSPVAGLIQQLGAFGAGNFSYIVPREAESGFDIRRTQIGSGPFYQTEYVPSSRLVFKRNPKYWDADRPYVDTVELPIIPEYAAGLAQFKAGAVYDYAVRADDVLSTKRAFPDMQMHLILAPVLNRKAFFGMAPNPPEKTPFRDERVRQAFSMSWDRDAWIDVFYNVSKLKAEGIPLATRWSTALHASDYEGWWLDPQGKDFGPNAKYFKRDIAEAKKLLAAAGHANGLDVDANYVTTGEYGLDFNNHVEVLIGFAADAGIRLKTVPVNWNTEWRPKFADAKGNFTGMSFRTPAINGIPDIGEKLFVQYNSKGGVQFTGFDPSGMGSFAGDPKMDEITNKLRVEFDTRKRIDLTLEFQRYAAGKQYQLLAPGGAESLTLSWPVLSNRMVFRDETVPFLNEWIDTAKAPLKQG